MWVLALMTAAPAHRVLAQDAADAGGGLEEITVTAQRRSENLQTVPIAVSAFTPEELERRNIKSALDLIQYVPNLNGNNNTGLGSANVYFLRGLGNTDSLATFDPPVGSYIDDVYIARQNSNNFGLFDVERIEVLRGPQGTLFGRNTTGGAINLILRKPGDTRRGFVEAGFGSFGETSVRASIDLPVTEALSTQFAGYFIESDGYIDNLVTGESDNGKDEKGFRAALRLKPNDDVTWDASLNYLYSGTFNKLGFECGTSAAPGTPAGGCSGRFANSAFGTTTPGVTNAFVTIPNPVTGGAATIDVPTTVTNGKADREPGIDTNTLIGASNLSFSVGENSTLSLITGFMHLQQDYLYDFSEGRQGRSIGGRTVANLSVAPLLQNPLILVDAAGVPAANGSFVLAQTSSGDQISQEIKLTGDARGGFIKYVAGAYYFREDYRTEFADVGTGFAAAVTTLGAQVPRPYITRVGADRNVESTTRAWAAYLQTDVNVSEQWTATVGLRYTDEVKSIAVTDLRDPRAAPVIAGVARPDLRLETSNLQRFGIPTTLGTALMTPRFALNFKPAEDVLLFASATRGFRSGGWNVRGGNAAVFAVFKPEKVWTYEIGAKSEWLDRRLRANLTLFQLNDEQFQSPSAFVDALGVTNFITRNDADFKNQGAELELQALPMDGLSLFLTAGYQDAKYENIATNTLTQQSDCLNRRNTGLVITPACASGIVTAQGTIATPVRTPELTLAVGGAWEFKLPGNGYTLTPALNVAYQSDTETAANNLNFYLDSSGVYNVDGTGRLVAGSRQEAYTLINASIALTSPDSNWRLTLDCSNCTDEVYTQSAISGYSFLSPPRTYTAKLNYSF